MALSLLSLTDSSLLLENMFSQQTINPKNQTKLRDFGVEGNVWLVLHNKDELTAVFIAAEASVRENVGIYRQTSPLLEP